jgi:hypothetical protein
MRRRGPRGGHLTGAGRARSAQPNVEARDSPVYAASASANHAKTASAKPALCKTATPSAPRSVRARSSSARENQRHEAEQTRRLGAYTASRTTSRPGRREQARPDDSGARLGLAASGGARISIGMSSASLHDAIGRNLIGRRRRRPSRSRGWNIKIAGRLSRPSPDGVARSLGAGSPGHDDAAQQRIGPAKQRIPLFGSGSQSWLARLRQSSARSSSSCRRRRRARELACPGFSAAPHAAPSRADLGCGRARRTGRARRERARARRSGRQRRPPRRRPRPRSTRACAARACR